MKDTKEAKTKLAKRALRRVKSTSIPVVPMMHMDGSQVLGDMRFSVRLSKPEMLGLIKSQTNYDELFEDLEVKEMELTDVAQRFCDQLIDKLWPRKGASKRLELVAKNAECAVYKDFAHSPSKLKATINAVREQYPRPQDWAPFIMLDDI